MEKKEIKVGSKTFVVRELLAVELDEALDLEKAKDKLKKQITIAASLSEEEYSNLTVKERIAILTAYNELNGFVDFQKSSKEEKSQ